MPIADPYVFGRFELRASERQLRVDGQPVALGSRAFDVLVALIERRDRVVTKSELLDLAWPGLVVEENNLQVQISALRKLLGAQTIGTIAGRGYRFTVADAAAGRPSAAVPAGLGGAAQPTGKPGAPKLLVADDNKVNRLLLSRMLQLQGHQVTSVDNGRLALQTLRSGPFDLLLLDLEMPELDGFAVLEQLRRDDELRDLPVIVTSSLEGVAKVARCIELGAEDYLHKPVDPVLLKARVDSCLEKKRLRDEQKALIRRLAAGAIAQDSRLTGTTMGGRRLPATALAVRLLDVTALAEAEPAADAIETIDSWHTLMFDAVEGRNGVVSRITGDGLLASFGAPLPEAPAQPASLAAVRSALEMVEMVELFNAERAGAGRPALAIAVGIAGGDVTAGCAGAGARTGYLCVGTTVDRAVRLQDLAAVQSQAILVDAATQRSVADRVAVQACAPVRLPGTEGAVPVYAVMTT